MPDSDTQSYKSLDTQKSSNPDESGYGTGSSRSISSLDSVHSEGLGNQAKGDAEQLKALVEEIIAEKDETTLSNKIHELTEYWSQITKVQYLLYRTEEAQLKKKMLEDKDILTKAAATYFPELKFNSNEEIVKKFEAFKEQYPCFKENNKYIDPMMKISIACSTAIDMTGPLVKISKTSPEACQQLITKHKDVLSSLTQKTMLDAFKGVFQENPDEKSIEMCCKVLQFEEEISAFSQLSSAYPNKTYNELAEESQKLLPSKISPEFVLSKRNKILGIVSTAIPEQNIPKKNKLSFISQFLSKLWESVSSFFEKISDLFKGKDEETQNQMRKGSTPSNFDQLHSEKGKKIGERLANHSQLKNTGGGSNGSQPLLTRSDTKLGSQQFAKDVNIAILQRGSEFINGAALIVDNLTQDAEAKTNLQKDSPAATKKPPIPTQEQQGVEQGHHQTNLKKTTTSQGGRTL